MLEYATAKLTHFTYAHTNFESIYFRLRCAEIHKLKILYSKRESREENLQNIYSKKNNNKPRDARVYARSCSIFVKINISNKN